MAYIQKRKLKNGNYSYRVKMRRHNCPELTVDVTFTSLEAAHNFVEEYENQFIEDPGAVRELKDNLRAYMQSKGLLELDGMKKPRFRILQNK